MANTRDTLGDRETMEALISDTLEVFEDSDIGALNSYAFENKKSLKSIILPNLVTASQDLLDGDYALETLEMPNIRSLGSYAFSHCHNLVSVQLENINYLNAYMFRYSGIGTVVLPICTSLGTYSFEDSRVGTVDCYKRIVFSSYIFDEAYSLTHLILRNDSVCPMTISSSDVFRYTPIINGIGWIYVPSDLVPEYKNADGWKDLEDQIVSIDEYPKQLQDETIDDTWAEIFANIDNGTYINKYDIGDIKYVNIGGTWLAMVIVGIEKDITASGAVAPITWISRDIFQTSTYNIKATSTVNWVNSSIRALLRNRIYPTIEPTVRNRILEVNKTYSVGNTTYNSTETLWIPSYREIIGNLDASYCETSGIDYVNFFTNASSRIKRNGPGLNSARSYWLRSKSSNQYAAYISSGGSSNTTDSLNNTNGVVLGFCT